MSEEITVGHFVILRTVTNQTKKYNERINLNLNFFKQVYRKAFYGVYDCRRWFIIYNLWNWETKITHKNANYGIS